jgi:hypothetical protein
MFRSTPDRGVRHWGANASAILGMGLINWIVSVAEIIEMLSVLYTDNARYRDAIDPK